MTARFLTGIEVLDTQVGGMYPGLVVLHEMVGAGGREFAVSSMLKNSEKEFDLSYIAITKTEEEILREIRLTFPHANIEKLVEKLKITSLADYYFRESIIPLRWITDKTAAFESLRGEKDLFSMLVEVFDRIEGGSMVFLDSLTDLARVTQTRFRWNDLIDLIIGLKKICIKKDILLMTLLTSKVFEKGREEELLDTADAIFVFEWEAEKDTITRWLYFRKFLGILPLLEKERILKYSVKLDPALGFTVSRLMRVL